MHFKSKTNKMTHLLTVLFLLTTMIVFSACSKETAQAPESLIKEFIAKHETMIDPSLADYYIENEKNDILAQIKDNIDGKKQDGTLQNIQQATFDLSGLIIDIVGEKEEYVDDMPMDFMKVATSGNITMTINDNNKTISMNSSIILEKEGGTWKITEKINPWG